MFVVISGKKGEFISSFRRWYLLKAYLFFYFLFFRAMMSPNRSE